MQLKMRKSATAFCGMLFPCYLWYSLRLLCCRNARLHPCMCKDWRSTVPGSSSTRSASTGDSASCDLRVCKTCLLTVDSIWFGTQTFWDSHINLGFWHLHHTFAAHWKKKHPRRSTQKSCKCNCSCFVLIWCEHCIELPYAVYMRYLHTY